MGKPKSVSLTLAFASDHAGFALKKDLIDDLNHHFPSIRCVDLGPQDAQRCDYPDYAHLAVHALLSGNIDRAVLICGSGIGMSMAANRFAGIRAALVESEFSAALSRAHNDANILCLGSRVLATAHACAILKRWLATPFEGGRHVQRLAKLDAEAFSRGAPAWPYKAQTSPSMKRSRGKRAVK